MTPQQNLKLLVVMDGDHRTVSAINLKASVRTGDRLRGSVTNV